MVDLKINNNVISWVSSFLDQRQQIVRCSSMSCKRVATSTGSPSGFKMYHPFFSRCKSELSEDILKYEDNTIIIEHPHVTSYPIIEDELDTIVNWCDTNHLNINPSKTKEMIITNHKHFPLPPPVSIHGSEIKRFEQYCYLGTTLTNKLNFSINTDETIKKATVIKYFS